MVQANFTAVNMTYINYLQMHSPSLQLPWQYIVVKPNEINKQTLHPQQLLQMYNSKIKCCFLVVKYQSAANI